MPSTPTHYVIAWDDFPHPRDRGRFLAAQLSARVAAIDRGLHWEIRPGAESIHLLLVTAEGQSSLRALARRWLDAAPEPDMWWSYADMREGASELAGTVLESDGRAIDLSLTQVGVHRGALRLDVAVYHPLFEDLDDQTAGSIGYVVVDSVEAKRDAEAILAELRALPGTIRARLIYERR